MQLLKNDKCLLGGVSDMNNLNMICFLSVVRTQNFSVTAKELSITQQAVSRNIQSLEQELNASLFYRDYHSVRLTQAGKAYYQAFSDYVQDLAAASRIWGEDDSDEVLRVGCCTWAGLPDLFVSAINNISGNFPNSPKIKVLQADDNDMSHFMGSGEVDVALIPRYLAKSIEEDCMVVPIFELPLYVVIEADHPLLNQTPIENFLHALPHLTSFAGEPDRESAAKRVYREYAKLDYRPQTVNVLPNLESAYTEVLMGNGITFSLKNKMIDCAELLLSPLPRSVTMSAVLLHRSENPHARRFIQYLEDSIGGVA